MLRVMTTRSIALACLVCAATAAHGAEPATPGDYEFRMPAGKSHEICTPLKKGEGIEFTFQTDAPVDFNVHYHDKSKVVMPLDVPGVMRQTHRVVAKVSNTYCMMWTATRMSDAGVLGNWQRLAPGTK
jgi:hypothetical protein